MAVLILTAFALRGASAHSPISIMSYMHAWNVCFKKTGHLLKEALTGMDGGMARTYGMSLHTLRPAKPGLDIGLGHLRRSAEVLKEERGDTGGDLDKILTRGGNVGGHGRRRRWRRQKHSERG